MKGKSMSTSKKKTIIALIALIIAAALLAGVYFIFAQKPVAGSKSIVIEVVSAAGETKSYALRTDAEYLRGAMEQAEGLSFEGTEGPYGMMVSTVNGETADYSQNGAYWSFYVNGEYCNYGIDSQPVEDGDSFAIVYTADKAA